MSAGVTTAMNSITTALSGMADTICTTALNCLAEVVPSIAPIMAAIIVIGIVYSVIRKFSH